MGFGNSNNWQTEAELRNARLAKQTSLDKLLEHVNWDAETLTLSLNGITLSWGDIEGTDDVATKDQIPSTSDITQITRDTISTGYLEANHLTITGDSTFSGTSININVGGATSGSALPSSIKLTGNDKYSTYKMSLSPYGLSFVPVQLDPDLYDPNECYLNVNSFKLKYGGDVKAQMYIASGMGYVTADNMSCSSLTVGGSSVATMADIPKNVVYRSNNGFDECTGSPNSMVCIVNTKLQYITRSTLKSWLGIE